MTWLYLVECDELFNKLEKSPVYAVPEFKEGFEYGWRAACRFLQSVPPEVVQQGSWPADDLRRAFVAGARWWEYASDSATMWPADVRRAEEEAEKRYTPSPRGTST